jgi:inosine/xanthosine triphosphatase
MGVLYIMFWYNNVIKGGWVLLLMKIAIGSENDHKYVAVVRETREDEFFSSSFHNDGFTFHSKGVPSGVRDQPLTLDETMRGAYNRSMNVYDEVTGADFGFGIESGLMRAFDGRYLQIAVCSLFDGDRPSFGISSSYEHPDSVLKLILKEGKTVEEAYKIEGYTRSDKLGSEEGAIGIWSNGRVKRLDVLSEAVRDSLFSFRAYRDC